MRMQPCISPLWDTAIAMVSLEEAGLDPAHPALVAASRWLVANQILGPGDWQVKNRKAEPGGWAFEFRNDFYPDVDDTAFVLMALSRVADPEPSALRASVRRGACVAAEHAERRRRLGRVRPREQPAVPEPHSVRGSQRDARSLDGGRDGAGDRVPRAMGWPSTHPVIERAKAYLRREQEADGSWFGRWGVNYVYGTSGVLRALEAIGLGALPEGAARGGVAAFGAEPGRRIRRNGAVVLRSGAEGAGEEHRVADGLGT